MGQAVPGGIPTRNKVRFHWCPFFLLAFLVCFSVRLYGANLEAGRRAYEHKDYANAMRELAPLAQAGQVDAQVLLGKMYMLGQGVPKDADVALKWFRAAAEQGNAQGQFFLGAMYLLPSKDVPQGLRWLRLSAEQGMPDAQLLLGMAYLKGSDVPQDLVEADMWLHLAATQGDTFASLQYEQAERRMTPAQIAKARAQVGAWKPRTPANSSID